MTISTMSTTIKEYFPKVTNDTSRSCYNEPVNLIPSFSSDIHYLNGDASSIVSILNKSFLLEEKRKQKNIRVIKEISKLEDNWNGNRAKGFTETLVKKALLIISDVVKQPKIFPTARQSIQFEFELDNGDYLEFEVLENIVEVYSEVGGKENEFKIPHNVHQINKVINDFYGLTDWK